MYCAWLKRLWKCVGKKVLHFRQNEEKKINKFDFGSLKTNHSPTIEPSAFFGKWCVQLIALFHSSIELIFMLHTIQQYMFSTSKRSRRLKQKWRRSTSTKWLYLREEEKKKPTLLVIHMKRTVVTALSAIKANEFTSTWLKPSNPISDERKAVLPPHFSSDHQVDVFFFQNSYSHKVISC